MSWLAQIAWALGMWICGSCVMSMFGSQVRITYKCAKKILARFIKIEDIDNYCDFAACGKYLNGVIIKNVVIVTAISAVILLLIPSIGITFYFIGMLLSWIMSIGATGITQQNVEETTAIFLRFTKPENVAAMTDFVPIIAQQIQNEKEFAAMLKKK